MEMSTYLENLEVSHHRTDIKMFEDRYNKCIFLDGDVKNKAHTTSIQPSFKGQRLVGPCENRIILRGEQ